MDESIELSDRISTDLAVIETVLREIRDMLVEYNEEMGKLLKEVGDERSGVGTKTEKTRCSNSHVEAVNKSVVGSSDNDGIGLAINHYPSVVLPTFSSTNNK